VFLWQNSSLCATTGAFALYQLGLSTQIPANVVFITDGSPRRVTIGKGRGILFKHTSEMRTFAYQSQLMGLTVTALLDTHQKNKIMTPITCNSWSKYDLA
jgi:hypothetical protein